MYHMIRNGEFVRQKSRKVPTMTKRIIGKKCRFFLHGFQSVLVQKNKFIFACSFMKKFLLFILTLAYVASSSGATIYIHQCMGKTIAWDVIENEGNSCTKCGMHKNAPNDCCKDHVKVLKVQNDQNIPNAYHSNVVLQAALPVEYFNLLTPVLFTSDKKTAESYIPSGQSSKINYCILYCTFLI